MNFNILNNNSQPSADELDQIGTSRDKAKNSVDAFRKLSRKIMKYFLWSLLPIFFCFVVVFATVIAVLHWVAPTQYNDLLVTLSVKPQAGGFVTDVLQAIESVIYVIFIHPILWLLSQLQTVIFFIGGGTLSNRILFNKSGDTWGIPQEYFVVLIISVGLIFVFIGLKLILIISEPQNQKAWHMRRTIQVFFLIVLGLALIPAIFFFFNTLINLITQIIIKGTNTNNQNIGLLIFNSSFNNGIHHFTSVPDSFNFSDNSNFNYIICLFSEGFMVYVFLLIVMNLFTRVFELFLFYCVSPLVVISTVTDTSGAYPHFRNWTNLVTQRFLLFSFIFLAYNIFLNAITLFADIAPNLPNNTTQPIFVLLGILGAGIVCVKTPTLLAAIIGGKASLIDSLGHLTTIATATSGIKMGAALTVAAVVGSSSSRQSRSQQLGSNNFLRSAGGGLGALRGIGGVATSSVGALVRPDKTLRYVKAGMGGALAGVAAYYGTKFIRAHKNKQATPLPASSDRNRSTNRNAIVSHREAAPASSNKGRNRK